MGSPCHEVPKDVKTFMLKDSVLGFASVSAGLCFRVSGSGFRAEASGLGFGVSIGVRVGGCSSSRVFHYVQTPSMEHASLASKQEEIQTLMMLNPKP